MSLGVEPDVLAGVDAEVAASLLAAAADVALVVDGAGVIRDVTVGSDGLELQGSSRWIGQTWAATVTVESRPKVQALLEDALKLAKRRWRHINHPSADGVDVPILYSAIQVGSEGQVVAFGRDLRVMATLQQRLVAAQQSMERDYLRLRHMETRYRLLFDMASEAVLVVNADSFAVVEANPAAAQLIGEPVKALVGRSLEECFAESMRPDVRALLTGVRTSGRSQEAKARLAGGDWELSLSASIFRQESGTQFLVRLAPVRDDMPAANSADPRAMLLQALANIPDGFVVTDPSGRILAANLAFVEMTQLASREQVEGEMFERWLGRASVDMNVLTANLRQHGSVRLFATTLRGQYGAASDVEISGTAVPHGEQPCLGFTVRDVGRRLAVDAATGGRELPRSASQLTGLVGRMPLKDIVSETTDLIEQLCIEAALELTRDNRASAAEMLGLSRQSLYVKLRRHGIGDLMSADDKSSSGGSP